MVCTLMVFAANVKFPSVKMVSIVDPSVFVTVHVFMPHVVRPRVLVTFESSQLKISDEFLMKYLRAGDVNFVVLIVRMSRRHLLTTIMLKIYVAETPVGNSV